MLLWPCAPCAPGQRAGAARPGLRRAGPAGAPRSPRHGGRSRSAEITHARPDWGIDERRRRRREQPVVEEVDCADAVRDAAPVPEGRRRPSSRAFSSSRRCRATSRRCCATPCARCCATTTSTSPTGTTCATCRCSAGRFGLDEYIDHLIEFIAALGPGAHVVAICQPCVAALAAAALMAEDDHPAQPASLTLMAGPIDCRISPTEVNRLATSKPIGWFEKNLISRVPWRLPGAGRRVYPGFLQLRAFISMNRERHVDAFRNYYAHLAADEFEPRPRSIARLLRGVHGRRRPVGRLLPRDGPARVPGLRAAARRADAARPEGRPVGDPAHRAAHHRRRARRHLRDRPDAGRAGPDARCGPGCAPTTCSRTSATTASSAAGAGRSTSTRSCAT